RCRMAWISAKTVAPSAAIHSTSMMRPIKPFTVVTCPVYENRPRTARLREGDGIPAGPADAEPEEPRTDQTVFGALLRGVALRAGFLAAGLTTASSAGVGSAGAGAMSTTS